MKNKVLPTMQRGKKLHSANSVSLIPVNNAKERNNSKLRDTMSEAAVYVGKQISAPKYLDSRRKQM